MASQFPYFRGTVLKVLTEEKVTPDDQTPMYLQKIQVSRQDNHEVIEMEVGSEFQPLNANQRLREGMQVVLTEQEVQTGQMQYVLADVYRLPALSWLAVGFLILVVAVARKRGLWSVVGMLASLGILSGIIVPQILRGADPIMVSLGGSALIAAITMYLSHGFHKQSHLALAAMMVTLVSVALLAVVAVKAAVLVGLGSEEAYFLQFGPFAQINLQGLLLGGIILGALGILDDITVAQISTVKQLVAVNPSLSFQELYERGLSVGKDHVASLVNTLVLAYAGANLPLFILFTSQSPFPMWVNVNNEIIAEEIVRTLVGSMGLVLAVPLATLIAAVAFHQPSVVPSSVANESTHESGAKPSSVRRKVASSRDRRR